MAFYTATEGNALRMDFEISRVGNPATVISRTSQTLTFEIDGYRYAFTGSGIVYDAAGRPTAGSLDGFQYSKDGAILFEKLAGSSGILHADFFARSEWLNDQMLVSSLVPGNDYIYGGDKDDWISDARGNNFLRGGGGNDTIVAGDGADHIYGFSPEGGPDGADSIKGGGGGDYIQGNSGNDSVDGGAGSDRINGGAGHDALYGNTGNDTINGNRGDDGIAGDEGNDRLRGGQGNDTVDGGDGDDVLSGDLGTDILWGGRGRDIFMFGPEHALPSELTERIYDYEDGVDQLSLGFLPSTFLSVAYPVGLGSNSELAEFAQILSDRNTGEGKVIVLEYTHFVQLLWSSHNDGRIDSILQIGGLTSANIGFDDFI